VFKPEVWGIKVIRKLTELLGAITAGKGVGLLMVKDAVDVPTMPRLVSVVDMVPVLVTVKVTVELCPRDEELKRTVPKSGCTVTGVGDPVDV